MSTSAKKIASVFIAWLFLLIGCQSKQKLDQLEEAWKDIPEVCRRGTLIDGNRSIEFEFKDNVAEFPNNPMYGTQLSRYQEIVNPYSPASQTLRGMRHFVPTNDGRWSLDGTTLTFKMAAPPLTVTLELDDSLSRIRKWDMLYLITNEDGTPRLRKHATGGIEYDELGRMARRWEDDGELPGEEFLFAYGD